MDNYTTDRKFKTLVKKSRSRASKFGEIYHDKKTRNGWHIKVNLKKKVSFWRSIEIRYYCLDDPARCFYDIMRYRAGGKMIDTCFDVKKKRRKTK